MKGNERGHVILSMVILWAGILGALYSFSAISLVAKSMTNAFMLFDGEEHGYGFRCFDSWKEFMLAGPYPLKLAGEKDEPVLCLPPRIDHGAIRESRETVPQAICFLADSVLKGDPSYQSHGLKKACDNL